MMRDDATIRGIPEAVAWRFGVTPRALLSDRRDREVARPRQVAMWLCRRVMLRTLPDVCRYFGRDHSTVTQAVKRVDKLMAADVQFAEVVWELARKLDSDEAASLRRMLVRRVA